MKINRHLTILLPLFDRYEFTLRILKYLNYIKCGYPIYLADGSKKKRITSSFLILNYPNLNITYKRYPYDHSLNIFFKKMILSLCDIKTKYVFQLDNDDIINTSFLDIGIKYLKKNPKFSCIGGKVIIFNVYNFLNKINANGFIRVSQEFYSNSKSILWDCPFKRLFYFKNLKPECIYKTKELHNAYNVCIKLNIKNYHELAWVFSTFFLIFGKFKLLNIPSTLRQNNTYYSAGKNIKFFFNYKKIIRYFKLMNKLLPKHKKKIYKINKFFKSQLFFRKNYLLAKNKETISLFGKILKNKRLIYFFFIKILTLNYTPKVNDNYDKFFSKIYRIFKL